VPGQPLGILLIADVLADVEVLHGCASAARMLSPIYGATKAFLALAEEAVVVARHREVP
jgi:hypothetical protein